MAEKKPVIPKVVHDFNKNARRISAPAIVNLRKNLAKFGDLSGFVILQNGQIISGNQRSKVINLNECHVTITKKNDQPETDGTIAVGYATHPSTKEKFPVRFVYWEDDNMVKEAMLTANHHAGTFNMQKLYNNFSKEIILESGFSINEWKTMDNLYKEEDARTAVIMESENRVAKSTPAANDESAEGEDDDIEDEDDDNFDDDEEAADNAYSEDDDGSDVPTSYMEAAGNDGETPKKEKKRKTSIDPGIQNAIDRVQQMDEVDRKERISKEKKRYKYSEEVRYGLLRVGKSYATLTDEERQKLNNLQRYYLKATGLNIGFATFLLKSENQAPEIEI